MNELKFSPAISLSKVPPVPGDNTGLLKEKKVYPDKEGFACYRKSFIHWFSNYKVSQMDQKTPKMNIVCWDTVYMSEFKKRIVCRLDNCLSIYTVDMTRIITVLRWVEEVKPLKSVICTDSMAVLQSLESGQSIQDDLLIEIKYILLNTKRLVISVIFMGLTLSGD